MNYLTKLLLDYKKENKLIQNQLAKKMGIHTPYLSKIITGKQSLTYKNLKKLDIKIDEDILKDSLIELIRNSDNFDFLIDCYNQLYKDKYLC